MLSKLKTYIVIFIASFFSSLLLVPIVKRIAARLKVFGLEKSSSVPRLGGVAVYFSFLFPLAALFFYDNSISALFTKDIRLLNGIFLGGAFVLILGVWDDVKGVSAFKKLFFEIAIACFVYWQGFQVVKLAIPFGNFMVLEGLSFPFTILWIVGIMNAINLIDGIDGLAAGISLFAVMTLGVISFLSGSVLNIVLCCALAGALLGFIKYNFNPASIYLGDSGSIFLGYILAIISVWGSQKSTTLIALLTPLIAFGIPIIDMILSVGRRYFRGISIFKRDLDHIHHRLKNMGFSQRKVVLILYGFCIILNALALVLYVSHSSSVILIFIVIGFIFGLNYLGYIKNQIFKDRWQEYELIRKERYCRYVIRKLIDNLKDVPAADKLWTVIKGYSKHMGVNYTRLQMRKSSRVAEPKEYMWSENGNDDFYNLKVVLPLIVRSDVVGDIEFRMKINGSARDLFLSEMDVLLKELQEFMNSVNNAPIKHGQIELAEDRVLEKII